MGSNRRKKSAARKLWDDDKGLDELVGKKCRAMWFVDKRFYPAVVIAFDGVDGVTVEFEDGTRQYNTKKMDVQVTEGMEELYARFPDAESQERKHSSVSSSGFQYADLQLSAVKSFNKVKPTRLSPPASERSLVLLNRRSSKEQSQRERDESEAENSAEIEEGADSDEYNESTEEDEDYSFDAGDYFSESDLMPANQPADRQSLDGYKARNSSSSKTRNSAVRRSSVKSRKESDKISSTPKRESSVKSRKASVKNSSTSKRESSVKGGNKSSKADQEQRGGSVATRVLKRLELLKQNIDTNLDWIGKECRALDHRDQTFYTARIVKYDGKGKFTVQFKDGRLQEQTRKIDIQVVEGLETLYSTYPHLRGSRRSAPKPKAESTTTNAPGGVQGGRKGRIRRRRGHNNNNKQVTEAPSKSPPTFAEVQDPAVMHVRESERGSVVRTGSDEEGEDPDLVKKVMARTSGSFRSIARKLRKARSRDGDDSGSTTSGMSSVSSSSSGSKSSTGSSISKAGSRKVHSLKDKAAKMLGRLEQLRMAWGTSEEGPEESMVEQQCYAMDYGAKKYRPAVIVRRDNKNTYAVQFDTGKVQSGTKKQDIKLLREIDVTPDSTPRRSSASRSRSPKPRQASPGRAFAL